MLNLTNISKRLANTGLFALSLSLLIFSGYSHAGSYQLPYAISKSTDGAAFFCTQKQGEKLEREMKKLLRELDIEPQLIAYNLQSNGLRFYSLATPPSETNTLDLNQQAKYRIKDDIVQLPTKNKGLRSVRTVSKKEVLLALLQHGRTTIFNGDACSVAALRDYIGVRQNIVAWVSHLQWGWPDGKAAFWHDKYWKKGTPLNHVSVDHALLDTFLNQEKYSIGCYTASKISYAHGVLDYYHRIKKNPRQAAIVRARLLHDQEPLLGVEPAAMWNFEADYDASTENIPGKILDIRRGIAANNFVPGDWSYFLNTDKISANKTGYEGSNAVYLGGGNFDDYYNDNQHSYTYLEKINEVYQWRHGVFNHVRDADKSRPISSEDLTRLSKVPAHGGLLFDFRVTPYLLGYEALPKLPRL